MEELVALLKRLNQSDSEYDKYLTFKDTGVTNKLLRNLTESRSWGVNNDFSKPNFIEEFECFVCQRLHENEKRIHQGKKPLQHIASREHYGCPKPTSFRDRPEGNLQLMTNTNWELEWIMARYKARLIRDWIKQGKRYTTEELDKQAHLLQFPEESYQWDAPVN